MANVILFSILISTGVVLAWTFPLDINPANIFLGGIKKFGFDLNPTTVKVEEIPESTTSQPDCFLRKISTNGDEIRINKTRAEVGPDEYTDFTELCADDDGEKRLSAGSLASLAG